MTDMLTTAEVADRLGVSPRVVRYLAETGQLRPARRIPVGRGVLMFDAAAVDAFRLNRAAELAEAAERWAPPAPAPALTVAPVGNLSAAKR